MIKSGIKKGDTKEPQTAPKLFPIDQKEKKKRAAPRKGGKKRVRQCATTTGAGPLFRGKRKGNCASEREGNPTSWGMGGGGDRLSERVSYPKKKRGTWHQKGGG